MKLHTLVKSMCLMGSLAIVGVSCTPPADPQEYAGPAIVSFDTDDNSLYLVASDEGAFSIELVTTRATNEPQMVTIEVDAEASTAIEGIHFSLPSTSATIPANAYSTTFQVVGDFENLGADGDQTLVLHIANAPEEAAATFDQTITLTLSQFCEFDINSLAGEYTLISEFWEPSTWPVTVTVESASENTLRLHSMYGPLAAAAGMPDGDSDVIMSVYHVQGLEYGASIDPKQKIYYATSPPFAAEYGDMWIQGSGFANTCGEFSLDLAFTVAAGSFGVYNEVLVKN